ncbi:MAG TPA: cysteine desulfurase family protein [Clostridia bacterium]|nr:cysteine desulfurase family protein [Clostridia bacterium]
MIYYFDNAATTKVDPNLTQIISEYNSEKFFNPSSLTAFSLSVANDIASARKSIGKVLGCNESEIYFTSGGTESDNTAIFGCLSKRSGNIVTTESEHSAVYKCANYLKNKGYDMRFADVNSDGSVNTESLLKNIDENTLLVALMHVNNETGAINDLEKLVKLVKSKNPNTFFFSDGTQAAGKIKVNLNILGVDAYAFSGHKFHAPKGIGGLYIKTGAKISQFHFGGGQEKGFRSGTENVSGIIAMSQALKIADDLIAENSQKFFDFKQILKSSFDTLGDYKIICENGSPAIFTIAFENIKSQVLSNMLEQEGIIIGLGSACSSKNKQNRIMTAIGLDRKYIEGVVRISFSKFNSIEEVKILADKMMKNISLLRKL